MEPKETVGAPGKKAGTRRRLTIKCEEVIPAGGTPSRQQQRRTVVCSRCGNEAEMIVDYADS